MTGEILRRFVRKSHLGYANELILKLNNGNPSEGVPKKNCEDQTNIDNWRASMKSNCWVVVTFRHKCLLSILYYDTVLHFVESLGARGFQMYFRLSISCMTVPLWPARFWSTECPVNNAPYFEHSNEIMGTLDFLGGCPAGSQLKPSKIEHCDKKDVVILMRWMKYRYWSEGGCDRAWWIIERRPES